MDVYHGTVRFLIESVMEGYNATVFAYGACAHLIPFEIRADIV